MEMGVVKKLLLFGNKIKTLMGEKRNDDRKNQKSAKDKKKARA